MIAGDLSARRGKRSEDDTQAVRCLARDERFDAEVVRAFEPLVSHFGISVVR